MLNGRAVHARAGDREQYEPVRAVAGAALEPGDARVLARAYLERFGLTELYAADLDAIAGRASQDQLVAELTRLGDVWLDAGVSSVDRARHAIALGAAHVIVGLETLSSWDALGGICAAVGGQRVAFSLDLRDGEPLMRRDLARNEAPEGLASRAADAGVQSIIVIDLKKVGTGVGLDLVLIARVRETVPHVTLLAGGGVRGLEDIRSLAEVGCDGVLVATALHDGRLGAADVASAREARLKGSPYRL